MQVVYNLEKLNEMLQAFSDVTRLNVSFVDQNFDQIVGVPRPCAFCDMIQTCGGEERCVCSDRVLLEKCRKSGCPTMHFCHAGLLDITIPLVQNHLVLGYLLLGRIRRTHDFREVRDRLLWLGEQQEVLERAFDELVYYDEQQVRGLVRILIAIVSQILNDSAVRTQSNHIAEQLAEYVQTHLEMSLKVDVLCRNLGVSKNTLYECVKSAFGCTVSDYVRRCRLEKAKTYLCETDMSVGEIAERCGFANVPYFFKLMQKYEFTTPRRYRKAHGRA
ncbi:MAG: helix-turn-helix domain-containing protein [Ruminococcaceae bacterium]|nr:helix-turn-helix domain-containing protein [Oscillospiraceae bacterium]